MTVFPLCYFPPVSWTAMALREGKVLVETCQYYRKQQYSNRMYFRMADQAKALIIPVARKGLEVPLKEARLVYQENWQRQHWRSLAFAYKNSPYFEFLQDAFHPLYEKRFRFLLDFDLAILEKITQWLQLELEVTLTEQFLPETAYARDLRKDFDPGRNILPDWFEAVPYAQVFPGFEPDLSVWDLMCNLGPESRTLLIRSISDPENEKE